MSADESTNGARDVDVEIDFSENFSTRIRIRGPIDEVRKVLPEVLVDAERARAMAMQKAEQARYRRQFFSTAHWLVFGVAALSVLGLVLDFLNIYDFNTRALYTMGG